MTLPKLVIAGSEKEPAKYFKAAAQGLDFELVPAIRQSRTQAWIRSPDHLVIWLAPQLPKTLHPLKLVGNERPFKMRSFIELHANAAFFYPADHDLREKQVDGFLREIQDGCIPTQTTGQTWREFVVPVILDPPALKYSDTFSPHSLSA